MLQKLEAILEYARDQRFPAHDPDSAFGERDENVERAAPDLDGLGTTTWSCLFPLLARSRPLAEVAVASQTDPFRTLVGDPPEGLNVDMTCLR